MNMFALLVRRIEVLLRYHLSTDGALKLEKDNTSPKRCYKLYNSQMQSVDLTRVTQIENEKGEYKML